MWVTSFPNMELFRDLFVQGGLGRPSKASQQKWISSHRPTQSKSWPPSLAPSPRDWCSKRAVSGDESASQPPLGSCLFQKSLGSRKARERGVLLSSDHLQAIPVSLHLSRKECIGPDMSPLCFQPQMGHSAGGMSPPSQPCPGGGISHPASPMDTLLTVIYFCCQITVLFNFPSKGDYIVWCVMSMEFQKLLDTIINCRILYLSKVWWSRAKTLGFFSV